MGVGVGEEENKEIIKVIQMMSPHLPFSPGTPDIPASLTTPGTTSPGVFSGRMASSSKAQPLSFRPFK